MRKLLLLALVITIVNAAVDAGDDIKPQKPQLDKLEQVVQPKGTLRSNAVAFGRMQIWCVIYHGRGRNAVLANNKWKFGEDAKMQAAIRTAAGSPGGMCFADGELWIGDAYGASIGCIRTEDWKVVRQFKGKQRDDRASQSYSGMAFDGKHLWVAWHWFKYDLPEASTQLLLKIDRETGKVINDYPLPAGTRQDGVHGLTWDGTNLWHVKDQTLSAIDPANGKVIAQHKLDRLIRPSGLAWDGTALWIVQFNGALWRLPMSKPEIRDRE